MTGLHCKERRGCSATPENNRSPFFKPVIQAKLSVNKSDGKYEKEADTVADRVMPEQNADNKFFFSPAQAIQRKCAQCEDEDKHIHRKEKISEPNANALSYSDGNNIAYSSGSTFLKAELKQENIAAQPADKAIPEGTNTPAACVYSVDYGNPRLLPVPACGASVQFDILQVKSSDKNCQKQLKGKQLSEVVTTDNNCLKTAVTTGPPVLLGDDGVPVFPATDTYGLNMPREFGIDCSYGIPCIQEMKQELSIDEKVVTTNIIRFEICGDKAGCMTRIFFNNVYLGVVGNGIYQDLTSTR